MENSNKINTKKLFLLRRNLALAGFFFLCVSGCDLYSNRIFSKTLLQVEDRKMTVQEFSKKLALKLRYLDPLSAKDTNIINKFKNSVVDIFKIIFQTNIFIYFSFKIMYYKNIHLIHILNINIKK